MFDVPLLTDLFNPLIELKDMYQTHQIKGQRCKCKIDKLTYSKS